MQPDELIRKRAKKVVDAGSVTLAQLQESIATNEKLDALLSQEKIELPEFPSEISVSNLPEYPSEISISNLPEIQKVEVINYPEQKAPIVNISPTSPIVNVDAPIVDVHQEEVVAELQNIADILSQEEGVEKTEIVDTEGNPVDFKELFDKLGNKIGNIKTVVSGGGGGLNQDQLRATLIRTTDTLAGASANGTRDLTSANTWYSVPSTIPTGDYILVVTLETNVGTIRWGFDGTGTPSATNGNQAPNQLTVRLTAGQVIYYASSTAGDDVNWTTKVI